MKLVGLGRVELPTSRLSGVRSNHLSYRPSTDLWSRARQLDPFPEGRKRSLRPRPSSEAQRLEMEALFEI